MCDQFCPSIGFVIDIHVIYSQHHTYLKWSDMLAMLWRLTVIRAGHSRSLSRYVVDRLVEINIVHRSRCTISEKLRASIRPVHDTNIPIMPFRSVINPNWAGTRLWHPIDVSHRHHPGKERIGQYIPRYSR